MAALRWSLSRESILPAALALDMADHIVTSLWELRLDPVYRDIIGDDVRPVNATARSG